MLRRTLLASLAALSLAALPLSARAQDLVVFAAASLTDALTAIGTDWTARTGVTVAFSFAGSPALARQIEQGAPADLFLSASPEWMDFLEQGGHLRQGTRRDLLGNTLVLIAHGRGAEPVVLDASLDLRGLLGEGRLSMAATSVPAGGYGQIALANLGLWDSVADRIATSENVRVALNYVARGELPLGIVYATDAAVQDDVTVLGTFPDGSHPPITYPAAITAESAHPGAQAFLEHLSGDAARAAWERFGFVVLP